MSTSLIDGTETTLRSFADELQTTMSGVRLHISWFGNQKQVSKDQKIQAAEAFYAESKAISMAKKLLDTNNDAWKKLTKIRGLMSAIWEKETLPYPEPGIRLMPRYWIDSFSERMEQLRRELKEAEREFDRRYQEVLRGEASNRLGYLYNPQDYPESIIGYFDVRWDFPNLDPPDYLQRLSPSVYRQETERIRNRFNEAVILAENAFLEELNKHVEHLLERLSGAEDGTPKIFRDSAIENLHEFFERFKRLNVGSSAELDRLVENARRIVNNVDAQHLRTNPTIRDSISRNLMTVRDTLDGMMVNRPRRNLIRSGTVSNQA